MTLLKLVKTLAVTAFAVITTLTVVSCKKETDNKPSDHTAEPSSTAVSSDIVTDVPTAEPTPAPVITKGNFNLDDIAAGDKVSVFTVETVETKDDIKTIVFNGILTVNGLLSKNDDGTCYLRIQKNSHPSSPLLTERKRKVTSPLIKLRHLKYSVPRKALFQ